MNKKQTEKKRPAEEKNGKRSRKRARLGSFFHLLFYFSLPQLPFYGWPREFIICFFSFPLNPNQKLWRDTQIGFLTISTSRGSFLECARSIPRVFDGHTKPRKNLCRDLTLDLDTSSPKEHSSISVPYVPQRSRSRRRSNRFLHASLNAVFSAGNHERAATTCTGGIPGIEKSGVCCPVGF